MTRPIHVITLAEVLPQHENTVIKVLREVAELTRQEEGCLRYDVYRDSTLPTRLNTIEIWSDQSALDRHMNRPHVRNAMVALIGKFAGIPQMRVLQAVDQLE